MRRAVGWRSRAAVRFSFKFLRQINAEYGFVTHGALTTQTLEGLPAVQGLQVPRRWPVTSAAAPTLRTIGKARRVTRHDLGDWAA